MSHNFVFVISVLNELNDMLQYLK